MQIAAILVLLFVANAAAAGANRSVYTPLSGPACTLIKEDKETGSTVHSCPGPTSAIKTLVAYDDQRMSVSLVLPNAKQEIPLNYWSVVTRSFSSLGPRAEWRMKSKAAVAVIVRVNATDADGGKTSMFAVARISEPEACVVEVIPASQPGANARARQIADNSAGKPCLQGESK